MNQTDESLLYIISFLIVLPIFIQLMDLTSYIALFLQIKSLPDQTHRILDMKSTSYYNTSQNK